jgi:hypothetical protein
LFAGQQETSAAGLSIHNALCPQPERVAINHPRPIVQACVECDRHLAGRRIDAGDFPAATLCARPRLRAAQYRTTLMLAMIGMAAVERFVGQRDGDNFKFRF